ncbi:hypothetical protein [Deinococcus peraridilitoris]|uniref:hypothetical protein n=1 Tax=Deinococcus peraridilitoris TaxID=432329 RepID=UPI000A00568E|nr:hypothetical protein [Deinococcus peraridilitoris]
MHFLREEERVFAVTPRGEREVTMQDVRDAAAFVVRASLSGGELHELQAGALHLKREAEHFSVRLAGHTALPADVGSAAHWLRGAGETPLHWDVREQLVTLQVCGVTVWNGGPQTAATLGMALALTLEHPGVFFGAGAPFPGAQRTALLPGARPDEKGLRVAAYTSRRFGLHLQDVGRVALPNTEYRTLQRELLGLLRAMTLEQPGAVPALRILEALVVGG